MKIQITKIKFSQLEVLQNELVLYSEFIQLKIDNDYLNSIIQLEILQKMYITLRNKLEKRNKMYLYNLTVGEAATILKCFSYKDRDFIHYETAVLSLIKEQIIKQLQNLKF